MEPTPTLKRSLSLPLVTFYGIGTILGAGIYVLVGKVAGAAGMHTPVAFLLASLLILPSAFSYAELVARFPRSAGEAIYVQEGLGWPPLSILVGLLIVSLGVLSTATLVHGLVGYLNVFFALPDTAVIIAAVLLMGAVVAWGISESVMLATLMTIVEIGAVQKADPPISSKSEYGILMDGDGVVHVVLQLCAHVQLPIVDPAVGDVHLEAR